MIGFPVLVIAISWMALFVASIMRGPTAGAHELRGTAENRHLCILLLRCARKKMSGERVKGKGIGGRGGGLLQEN